MDDKQRERLLIIVSLTCVALFLGNMFIVDPLTAKWKDHSAQIAKLEQSLKDGKIIVDRKTAIRDRWKDMLEHSLPADKSQAEGMVTGEVGVWSRASQLTVTSIKPRWLVNPDDPAQQLEVRVSAGGSLASISRFLYELESDKMAVRLHDVDITARDDRGSQLELVARFTGIILPEEKS